MIKTRIEEMALQGMPPFLIARQLRISETLAKSIVEEIRAEAARKARNFQVSLIKQK